MNGDTKTDHRRDGGRGWDVGDRRYLYYSYFNQMNGGEGGRLGLPYSLNYFWGRSAVPPSAKYGN